MSVIVRNSDIVPYVCTDSGVCERDQSNQSTLSLHACRAGCQPDGVADVYWEKANEFAQHVIDNQRHKPDSGFASSCFVCANFFVREREDPLQVDILCAVEEGIPDVYYFQCFRANDIEDPFRSFHVDISRPGHVHVESENFFTVTTYNAAEDNFAAEHFFFVLDFIALGFCIGHDSLTMNLKDEWKTKRRARRGNRRFNLELDSLWLLLGRGYTYYENRGYREDVARSKRCIKMQALHEVGNIVFVGSTTVLQLARQLFAAESEEATMDIVVAYFLESTEEVNAETIGYAMSNFRKCLAALYETDAYKAFFAERYYTKTIDDVTVQNMRHMVFYQDVTFL